MVHKLSKVSSKVARAKLVRSKHNRKYAPKSSVAKSAVKRHKGTSKALQKLSHKGRKVRSRLSKLVAAKKAKSALRKSGKKAPVRKAVKPTGKRLVAKRK